MMGTVTREQCDLLTQKELETIYDELCECCGGVLNFRDSNCRYYCDAFGTFAQKILEEGEGE